MPIWCKRGLTFSGIICTCGVETASTTGTDFTGSQTRHYVLPELIGRSKITIYCENIKTSQNRKIGNR